MIDFHSHIIPGIDDGSKSVENSLQMLKLSYDKGIRTTVLTPHYYPKGQESLDVFLEKRQHKYEELMEAVKGSEHPLPEIKLGCEVNLSANIGEYEGLEKLCIEGTDYILLEMPYTLWDENVCDWIYGIKLKGMRPVMAHIDRYLSVPKKDLKNLFDLELLYQVNADAFLNFGVKREIAKLICRGFVHVLGSDMHNLDDRTNNLDKAMRVLKNQFGDDYVRFLTENAEAMIKNKRPHLHSHAYLHKVGALSMIFGKKAKE